MQDYKEGSTGRGGHFILSGDSGSIIATRARLSDSSLFPTVAFFLLLSSTVFPPPSPFQISPSRVPRSSITLPENRGRRRSPSL